MPHLWERCAGVGMTVTILELGIDSVQVFDFLPCRSMFDSVCRERRGCWCDRERATRQSVSAAPLYNEIYVMLAIVNKM